MEKLTDNQTELRIIVKGLETKTESLNLMDMEGKTVHILGSKRSIILDDGSIIKGDDDSYIGKYNWD